MKNFLFAIAIMLLASCSSNNNKASTTDSMNRINDNSIGPDTSTGPNPDGYAPPNTTMDTSQARKDSINARKH